MKTKIIVAIFSLFIMAACSESFLDLNPSTSISANTFFVTQADFEQAVNGTYAPLRSIYGGGRNAAWAMGEMRSDNTHFNYYAGHRGSIGLENIADFLEDPSTNFAIGNKYQDNYNIIGRANQILARIDNAAIPEDVKDNLKGQALFLRALSYFDLVQYFGGVPLHLTPVTSVPESMMPRASKEEVYEQIIKDAQEAIGLLPKKGVQSKGRATEGTARTLLGNVYIVLKRWSDAETVLTPVTTHGYRLLDNYAEVFDPTKKGNDESIFEAQFMQGATGLQSNFIYTFLPRISDTRPLTGAGGNAILNSEGGFNVPTPDLIAAYEPNDLRFDASIRFHTGGGFTDMPYIKKYLHPHSLHNNTDNNWPIYRYSEVLLMLAEAKNEQSGKSSQALSDLNAVRKRADLPDITTTNQAELRDIIMQERRVELAFENKRWLDLVRTGKAVDVMNAYGARVKANPSQYYYLLEGEGPVSNSYNVTANHMLFPIPAREMNLNPKLVQNPPFN